MPKEVRRRAAVGINETSGGDMKPPTAKRKYVRKAVIDTRQYDYLGDGDSLAKVRSAKTCANRWSAILMARDNRKKAIMAKDSNNETSLGVNAMFDCSDLIIPPTAELLEIEAKKAMEKWNALDSRVINADVEDDDVGDKSDAASADGSTKLGRKRVIKEAMLPPNFDYQCRNKQPNYNEGEDNSSKKCGKRVISLLDPTQTLDYESELWKVFKSMPTVREVEQKHALGSSDETVATNVDMNNGCQHTLTITRTLENLRRKYTRIDAHALGRLRVRDRHSSLYDYSGGATVTNNSESLQTTLRFEILKPNVEDLRRGSGPDVNRMEVELHGSHHTLLDLHHTLVEHASTHNFCRNSDSCISPGVFLIENVLYTHGDDGESAADTIIKRLNVSHSSQSGKKKETKSLSNDNSDDDDIDKVQSIPKVMPMDQVKLEVLNLRLGIKYSHINLQSQSMEENVFWDKSNVSSIFVTSIQSHPRPCSSSSADENDQNGESSISNRVPVIIHDIWSSSQQSLTHNLCAACEYLPATVATSNDMLTDASLAIGDAMGTPLCASCFRELHYQKSEELGGDILQLRPYRSHLKVFPVDSSR